MDFAPYPSSYATCSLDPHLLDTTQLTKSDFRFHEPEALADFCNSKELG
jgi:hypothetical protein